MELVRLAPKKPEIVGFRVFISLAKLAFSVLTDVLTDDKTTVYRSMNIYLSLTYRYHIPTVVETPLPANGVQD